MHLHIIKVHDLNDIKALIYSLINKALRNMIINSNKYTVSFAYTDKKIPLVSHYHLFCFHLPVQLADHSESRNLLIHLVKRKSVRV